MFGFGYRNHPEKAGSECHCGHRGWHGSASGSALQYSSSEVGMLQLGYQLMRFCASGRGEKTSTAKLLVTENNDQQEGYFLETGT